MDRVVGRGAAVIAEANGASNSRSDVEKCRRWQRSGFDTVALLWSAQRGAEVLSAIQSAECLPFRRGLMVASPTRSGLRVMAWPEYGVVKVEGRLAAAIDGSSSSHRLATRDELRAAPAAMGREVAGLLGAMPEGAVVGVGRFDLATERDFEDRAEGLDLLRAMRALRPPGCKVDVIAAADGRVETVAVVTARRARRLFRAYDKSVESGEGLPGSRVRFEAQVRRNASQRQAPNTVADSDLRAAFGRTIEPFLKGEPVTVTSPTGVVDELARQVADGRQTIARAERLVGAAELLRRFGRAVYASNDQSSRRLRALREAGIAIDDELGADARIPVSELLASALEEWSGGAS